MLRTPDLNYSARPYPPAQAAEAQEMLLSRKSNGKIVPIPRSCSEHRCDRLA